MAGLDNLVSGFVDGMNTANSWKDRRRAQQYEDEDRATAKEDRKRSIDWATEDRSRRMRREDLAWAEEDRQRAAAAEERQMLLDAFGAPADEQIAAQDGAGSAAGGQAAGALPSADPMAGMGGDYSLGVPAPPVRSIAPPPPLTGAAGGPVPPTGVQPLAGPAGMSIPGAPPAAQPDLSYGSMQDRPSRTILEPTLGQRPGQKPEPEFADMTYEQKLAAIANQPAFDATQDPDAAMNPVEVYRRRSDAPPSSQKGQRDQQDLQREWEQNVNGATVAGGMRPPTEENPRLPKGTTKYPMPPLRGIPLTQERTGPVDMPRPAPPRPTPAALDIGAPSGEGFRLRPSQPPMAAQAPGPNARSGPVDTPPPPAPLPRPGSGAPSKAAVAVPLPQGTTPQTAPASVTTAAAQAGDAPPSVKIALGTAPDGPSPAGRPRLAFGLNAPIEVTPEKQHEAAQAFLGHYLDKGVKSVVQYYLKTGQPDKAQAYAKWADDSANQRMMGIWAGAVQSAAIGDTEGMLDGMANYYNAINPNLSVLRQGSGMIKDDQGNIIGAQITFRNRKTGETFTQTYHGAEDMIRQGISALAPEKMFELLYEEQKAAATAASKGGGRAMTAVEYAQTNQGRVKAAMSDLAKADPWGFAKLSQDEKVQKAVEYLQAQDAAVDAYSTGDMPGGLDVPLDLPPE